MSNAVWLILAMYIAVMLASVLKIHYDQGGAWGVSIIASLFSPPIMVSAFLIILFIVFYKSTIKKETLSERKCFFNNVRILLDATPFIHDIVAFTLYCAFKESIRSAMTYMAQQFTKVEDLVYAGA